MAALKKTKNTNVHRVLILCILNSTWNVLESSLCSTFPKIYFKHSFGFGQNKTSISWIIWHSAVAEDVKTTSKPANRWQQSSLILADQRFVLESLEQQRDSSL